MKQLIHDFPKHIEEALTIAQAAVLTNPTNKTKKRRTYKIKIR